MDSKLKISNKHLEKELHEAQERLKQEPNRWVGYEKVGRVLYWMNNPSAAEYFQKAAEIRVGTLRPNRLQGWELITVGNYFRLAGEFTAAQNYFLRAYEMLKMQVGDISNPEGINLHPIQDLVTVCFLLKRYDEVEIYDKLLREDDPDPNPNNVAHQFGLLANARITNDTSKAQRVIKNLTLGLQRGLKLGRKIQDTGGITGFDLYELALEILDEINREIK